MKLAMASAVLLVSGASFISAVPTDSSRAEDIPPTAFAPQPQSDQPTSRAAPSRGASATAQQTGSASDAQVAVPLAQRVAPVMSNQPVSGAASK